MFIKKKHIQVILFSSITIAVVLITTVIGQGLYIQWKKDSFAAKYRNSIYELSAELFKGDVILSNVDVRSEKDGMSNEVPYMSGDIKNNTGKTITSLLVEIYFAAPDGGVLYKSWIYPLEEAQLAGGNLFFGKVRKEAVLLPGESLSFRQMLRNCPQEVVSHAAKKGSFAKGDSQKGIKVVCSVAGLSVI
jgi:hypothetical protein